MPFFRSLKQDATTRDVIEQRLEIFRHLLPANELILRGPSDLTAGERELIGTYVSAKNSCTYCYGGHAAAAAAFGIDPALVESMVADLDTAPVPEKLKPVLRFAAKLTTQPSRLVQADADAVFAAGWSERALQDVIFTCAWFNFMNRIVDGHGIQALPEMYAERGRRHAELGYMTQFESLLANAGSSAGH